MSTKHTDPTFLARIVRSQVRRAWRFGEDVHCWRGGEVIPPGAPFDVGHLDPDAAPTMGNLAPECPRHNRSEGGRRGAAITNGKTRTTRAPGLATPRPDRGRLAPW